MQSFGHKDNIKLFSFSRIASCVHLTDVPGCPSMYHHNEGYPNPQHSNEGNIFLTFIVLTLRLCLCQILAVISDVSNLLLCNALSTSSLHWLELCGHWLTGVECPCFHWLTSGVSMFPLAEALASRLTPASRIPE